MSWFCTACNCLAPKMWSQEVLGTWHAPGSADFAVAPTLSSSLQVRDAFMECLKSLTTAQGSTVVLLSRCTELPGLFNSTSPRGSPWGGWGYGSTFSLHQGQLSQNTSQISSASILKMVIPNTGELSNLSDLWGALGSVRNKFFFFSILAFPYPPSLLKGEKLYMSSEELKDSF